MDSLIEGPISSARAADEEMIETSERQAATPYEPFLQDWYPAPNERDATRDAGSLTLTNRQLAIIGFIGVLSIGLTAGLGYVAGRVASAGQVPGRVLMVESAQAVPAVIPSIPASTVPVIGQAKAVVSAAESVAAKASPVPPTPAGTAVGQGLDSGGLGFWQVGALDKGMASVSEKYLQDNGLPARLEPIAGSGQLRVLVGPAQGSELNDMKKKLDSLGFQAFLKRY